MTNSSAQTRSGTVRNSAISPRATVLATGCGESPSAARIASGKARIRPRKQPTSAIWKVTSSDCMICGNRSRSGGNMRCRIEPSAGRPRMSLSHDTPTLLKDQMRKASASTQTMKASAPGLWKRGTPSARPGVTEACGARAWLVPLMPPRQWL
jgi:hypothetical protein